MIEILAIISGFIIVYYLGFFIIYIHKYIADKIKISKYYEERPQLEMLIRGGENLNEPYIHRLRTHYNLESQLENANRVDFNSSENLDLDTLYNMSKDKLPEENDVKKEEKKDNLEEKISFTIVDRLKRIEESEDEEIEKMVNDNFPLGFMVSEDYYNNREIYKKGLKDAIEYKKKESEW